MSGLFLVEMETNIKASPWPKTNLAVGAEAPRAHEKGFSAPSATYLMGARMHSDHEIFNRGVSQGRIVRLAFLSEEPGRELAKRWAPLYYSRGRADLDGSECYYFWDFEAGEGHNFTALSPSEIAGMELTEDSFRLEDIHGSATMAGGPGNGADGSGS